MTSLITDEEIKKQTQNMLEIKLKLKLDLMVKLYLKMPHLKARHNGKMRDYYRILDPPLGSGAYGEVRKCIFKENIMDKKSSLKQFRAVKIMSRAYMEDKDIKAFENEVDIMLTLNNNQGHPNILKIYHYFEDPKRYLLVTELCQGGELYKLALREKKFEPKKAAFILKQLLSAVNYMHSKNIVHRDLKPENILLEEKDDLGAMQTIKLIDFGTGRKFNPAIN